MDNKNNAGYAGIIDLVLEKQGENVVSPKKYFNGVFKLSPKMELDIEKIPAYFLMQLGGGIVEGEKYKIAVEIKENTRALLTTQAAGKIWKPILLDNMLIDPREDNIEGLGFMEGYKNFGSLIILNEKIDKKIIEHLIEEVLKLNLDIKFGITGLEVNGFVLRVIGNLTQDLEEVIGLCHNYIR